MEDYKIKMYRRTCVKEIKDSLTFNNGGVKFKKGNYGGSLQ